MKRMKGSPKMILRVLSMLRSARGRSMLLQSMQMSMSSGYLW